MTAVLELDGVTKAYPGPVEVLHGVSLAVAAGELAAVVGPSGSGKSTLLHIMGTLERATAGAVRVAGHDVAAMGEAELAALKGSSPGAIEAPETPAIEDTPQDTETPGSPVEKGQQG